MQFDHMFIKKKLSDTKPHQRLRQSMGIYTSTQEEKFVSGKRKLKLKCDEMFGRFKHSRAAE
jgi:hypothetical protein